MLQIFEQYKFSEIQFNSTSADGSSSDSDDFTFAGVKVSEGLIDVVLSLLRCHPDALYSVEHVEDWDRLLANHDIGYSDEDNLYILNNSVAFANESLKASDGVSSMPRTCSDDKKEKKHRAQIFKTFKKDNNPFNFDLISRIPLKTAILDLALYKSHSGSNNELLENALDLMFHTSCRFENILENGADLQILSDHSDVKLYKYIRKEVHRLQILTESFESWGMDNEFSGIDWGCATDCARLLIELRILCSSNKADLGHGMGGSYVDRDDTALRVA